jgi:hypothetical protein
MEQRPLMVVSSAFKRDMEDKSTYDQTMSEYNVVVAEEVELTEDQQFEKQSYMDKLKTELGEYAQTQPEVVREHILNIVSDYQLETAATAMVLRSENIGFNSKPYGGYTIKSDHIRGVVQSVAQNNGLETPEVFVGSNELHQKVKPPKVPSRENKPTQTQRHGYKNRGRGPLTDDMLKEVQDFNEQMTHRREEQEEGLQQRKSQELEENNTNNQPEQVEPENTEQGQKRGNLRIGTRNTDRNL